MDLKSQALLMYYRLSKQGIPVRCSVEEGCKIFSDMEQRRIALTRFADGTELSTVFLCFNHALPDAEPILFETIYFQSEKTLDDPLWRYATLKDSLEGHYRKVSEIGKEIAYDMCKWDELMN